MSKKIAPTNPNGKAEAIFISKRKLYLKQFYILKFDLRGLYFYVINLSSYIL